MDDFILKKEYGTETQIHVSSTEFWAFVKMASAVYGHAYVNLDVSGETDDFNDKVFTFTYGVY